MLADIETMTITWRSIGSFYIYCDNNGEVYMQC